MASVLALALHLGAGGAGVASAEPPPGFQETVAFGGTFGGLSGPTAIEFSQDGRIFVAEKSGLIKVFDNLGDKTPTTFADLRTEVYNYWDRGLLGMALDPDFPADPYIYVLYTRDAMPGGTPPRWGTANASDDPCPSPPGPTADGCVVTGRLARLNATTSPVTVTPLITDWCQQYPSHTTGDLAFGADGALYASAGDGASFTFVDYGQDGTPVNPCGDPLGEGGALRSQDARTTSDPTGLDGSILRIDPNTGTGYPGNPYAGSGDPNQARIAAFGQRNPFRFTVRPGTSEVWSGDVGWNEWEEINRVADPTGGAENFGWPCYEGSNTASSRQPGYEGANLGLCETLYTSGDPNLARPYFAYQHSAKVVAGESCPTGSSSISGLAFYERGDFPNAYNGALFFADFSRKCLWAMMPGAGGLPNPADIRTFRPNAADPVELEVSPAGELFYVDLAGSIRRITYFDGNVPPNAVATATPANGPAPLSVQLSAAGSSDPDGDPLTYDWDLDGDGDFGDSSSPTPSYDYEEPGTHTATVRVTDPDGASDTDSVSVQVDNAPPEAEITAPAGSLRWGVGDEIVYSGSGTDPQEGSLPASRFSWSLIINHCPSNCHQHTIEQVGGVSGGTFVAPDHEYPSSLLFRLTVRDAEGLTDTDQVTIDPRTAVVSLAGAPAGLDGLELGLDGATGQSPFDTTVIDGSQHTVFAPAVHAAGGETWYFQGWSDGGAIAHDVVADGNLDLTASYDRNQPPLVVATAAPTTGPAPLAVQFSATQSIDPEGSTLSFAWDLDEDGAFDDGDEPTASRVYTAPGPHQAAVRVTDEDGASAVGRVDVRVEPEAVEDSSGVDAAVSESCGGRAPTLTGTPGRDVIKGTRAADVISSLGGRDRVSGGGGDDVICGGRGRDRLAGGRGDDRLFGQAGRDRLRGGKGFDACSGGRGFDRGFDCEAGRSAAL